jgi:hypothetical protein
MFTSEAGSRAKSSILTCDQFLPSAQTLQRDSILTGSVHLVALLEGFGHSRGYYFLRQ